jgi:hypothetical protein
MCWGLSWLPAEILVCITENYVKQTGRITLTDEREKVNGTDQDTDENQQD